MSSKSALLAESRLTQAEGGAVSATRRPRFVLADPSIATDKGHYLEYALRVLGAVERAGDRTTLLAVNTAFDPVSLSTTGIIVDPAFTYDIWGRPAKAGRASKYSAQERRAEYRHRVGRVGLIWAMSEQPGVVVEYGHRFGMSPRQLYWLKRAMGIREEMAALDIEEGETEVDRLRYVLRNQKNQNGRSSGKGSRFASIDAANRKAEQFAQELGELIARHELTSDDYIFLPTMGWHDLAGLAVYLQEHDANTIPHMGLLFRRNIYDCYPDEYDQHGYPVHDLRYAFDRLNRLDTQSRVSILTDTEELSEQYRTVTERDVHTLPIPAPDHEDTEPPSEEKRKRAAELADNNRSLVYLGDAREEKGFQYLPNLLNEQCARANARKITGEEAEAAPMRLNTQCYFAPDFDDPDIIQAVALVRNQAPHDCDIMDGVLDGDAYARAIREAGAILVPYARQNYAARSSGIFIEAITAGKPVIVTAGTSMSEMLDARSFDYHSNAIAPSDVIGGTVASAIRWRVEPSDHLVQPDRDGRIRIDDGRVHYFTAPAPKTATHIWLSFKLDERSSALFSRVTLAARDIDSEQIGEDVSYIIGGGNTTRSIVVKVVPGAHDIWVSIANPFSFTAFTLEDISLSWVRTHDPIARCPGGVTFVNDGDAEEKLAHFLSAARELEYDFPAYRDSARHLQEDLAAYHNADRLVSDALTAAGLGAEETTSASVDVDSKMEAKQ